LMVNNTQSSVGIEKRLKSAQLLAFSDDIGTNVFSSQRLIAILLILNKAKYLGSHFSAENMALRS
ncbi:unnamed protein product, partial [Ceratitis capitata]